MKFPTMTKFKEEAMSDTATMERTEQPAFPALDDDFILRSFVSEILMSCLFDAQEAQQQERLDKKQREYEEWVNFNQCPYFDNQHTFFVWKTTTPEGKEYDKITKWLYEHGNVVEVKRESRAWLLGNSIELRSYLDCLGINYKAFHVEMEKRATDGWKRFINNLPCEMNEAK
jgi:hypothetical protein